MAPTLDFTLRPFRMWLERIDVYDDKIEATRHRADASQPPRPFGTFTACTLVNTIPSGPGINIFDVIHRLAVETRCNRFRRARPAQCPAYCASIPMDTLTVTVTCVNPRSNEAAPICDAS